MDMFDMKAFEDHSFDIVLDKGTMDAILVSEQARCILYKATSIPHRLQS